MQKGSNPMFSTIKNMWREARADVIQKHAAELLNLYEQFGGYERYELTSAFEAVKGDLEIEHGEFAGWQAADKAAAAKQLLKMGKEAFGVNQRGACGVGLLSIYLEAQTLPGDQAKRLVSDIENWYLRAIKSDLRR
jgi:hypothetical protein